LFIDISDEDVESYFHLFDEGLYIIENSNRWKNALIMINRLCFGNKTEELHKLLDEIVGINQLKNWLQLNERPYFPNDSNSLDIILEKIISLGNFSILHNQREITDFMNNYDEIFACKEKYRGEMKKLKSRIRDSIIYYKLYPERPNDTITKIHVDRAKKLVRLVIESLIVSIEKKNIINLAR
jgi:hypothetical protein